LRLRRTCTARRSRCSRWSRPGRAADAVRLAQICRYRRAGLSLATIRDLLEAGERDRDATLTARLAALNEELRRYARGSASSWSCWAAIPDTS
jgi:hypothetical protein